MSFSRAVYLIIHQPTFSIWPYYLLIYLVSVCLHADLYASLCNIQLSLHKTCHNWDMRNVSLKSQYSRFLVFGGKLLTHRNKKTPFGLREKSTLVFLPTMIPAKPQFNIESHVYLWPNRNILLSASGCRRSHIECYAPARWPEMSRKEKKGSEGKLSLYTINGYIAM